MNEEFIPRYLDDCVTAIKSINIEEIRKAIGYLVSTRNNRGRLFILGVGGGAGHASHAVNDFRKIAGIEAYSPSDNVSELTARVNDDGWDTCYMNWLSVSQISSKDAVMVISVGGGDEIRNVSVNLIRALDYAKSQNARIIGIVGRDGGYTKKIADVCMIIPPVRSDLITPVTESIQAVIWHLLVSSPELQKFQMKWESHSDE